MIERQPGTLAFGVLLMVAVLLVFPPLAFLIKTSFSVAGAGPEPTLGFGNFTTVLKESGVELWRVTILYAIGSSLVALVLGTSSAWLVARTDVPFQRLAFMGAFLSLAVPPIIKSMGWILLLGPNKGLINVVLMQLLGLEQSPFNLFSLSGMILIEGLLWTPIVFLLTLPPLSMADPALEEAAAVCGARFRQILRYVMVPLARPAILAVLLLTFIRALESFEVPLLIGMPGNLHTFTTVVFESINDGLFPHYEEASAYATLLVVLVTIPLVLYYRVTREANRFATVTGKGYRPRLIQLGPWRWVGALWNLLIPLSLIAPLLILFWASFLPIYTLPSLDDFAKMSFANYVHVWQKPATPRGLWNSLAVGALSATFTAALTFVFAWYVLRRRGLARWALDFTASIPLVFPGIVLGIAVLILFLQAPIIPIYGTIWILVLAFVIRFLPYGMRYCYSGIVSIHQELEECARTSGARTGRVLMSIVLPLALPAVVAAWLYIFLVSVRDLSVVILLAGPQSQVFATVIYDLWRTGELPEVGAVSMIVAILVTAVALAFERVSRRFQLRG